MTLLLPRKDVSRPRTIHPDDIGQNLAGSMFEAGRRGPTLFGSGAAEEDDRGLFSLEMELNRARTDIARGALRDSIRDGERPPVSTDYDTIEDYQRAQTDYLAGIQSDIQSRYTPPDVLNERYQVPGLTFDKAMPEEEARLLFQSKVREKVREDIIQQNRSSWLLGNAAMLAGGFYAAALDPLEIASSVIPIVSATRQAVWTTRFGVTAGRALTGAVEGAIGNALLEPAYYHLSKGQQLNYTMRDALFNVGVGALLGGTIGGGIGAISHLRGRADRELAEAREIAARGAVGQIFEGKIPDVGEFDRDLSAARLNQIKEVERSVEASIFEARSKQFMNPTVLDLQADALDPLLRLPEDGDPDRFIFENRRRLGELLGENRSDAIIVRNGAFEARPEATLTADRGFRRRRLREARKEARATARVWSGFFHSMWKRYGVSPDDVKAVLPRAGEFVRGLDTVAATGEQVAQAFDAALKARPGRTGERAAPSVLAKKGLHVEMLYPGYGKLDTREGRVTARGDEEFFDVRLMKGKKIVGGVSFKTRGAVDGEPAKLSIDTMSVAPEMRGLGVGRAFYTEIFEAARRAGVRAIESDYSVSGSAANVWRALARDGYDVKEHAHAKYDADEDRWTAVDPDNPKVVTPPFSLKVPEVEAGDRYFAQGAPEGVNALMDRTTGLILLGETANASTALHESSHVFFDIMGHLASRPDATPSLREDFGKILNWMGARRWEDVSPNQAHLSAQDHKKLKAFPGREYTVPRALRDAAPRELKAHIREVLTNFQGEGRKVLDLQLPGMDEARPIEITNATKKKISDFRFGTAAAYIVHDLPGFLADARIDWAYRPDYHKRPDEARSVGIDDKKIARKAELGVQGVWQGRAAVLIDGVPRSVNITLQHIQRGNSDYVQLYGLKFDAPGSANELGLLSAVGVEVRQDPVRPGAQDGLKFSTGQVNRRDEDRAIALMNTKVRDAEGKPALVYHTTQEDFTAFRPLAEFSTATSEAQARIGGGQGSRVIPVYLDVRNPKVVDAEPRLDGSPDERIDLLRELEREGFDGLKVGDRWITVRPEQVKSAFAREYDLKNPDFLAQPTRRVESARQIIEADIAELQAQIRAYEKELDAVGRAPIVHALKTLGRVDPEGDLGKALTRALGGNRMLARQRFPSLFKHGGIGAGDNIHVNDLPEGYAEIAGGEEFGDYVDPEWLAEAVAAEDAGVPIRPAHIEYIEAQLTQLEADLRYLGDPFAGERWAAQTRRPVRPTETEAFKKWFGESKIVDENGKPLVVFHGTNRGFDAFSDAFLNFESDLGGGHYFTSSDQDAVRNYSGESGPDFNNKVEHLVDQLEGSGEFDDYTPEQIRDIARKRLGSEGSQRVEPFYLKIENPLVIGDPHRMGHGSTLFERGYGPNSDEYLAEAEARLEEDGDLEGADDIERRMLIREMAEDLAFENDDFAQPPGPTVANLLDEIERAVEDLEVEGADIAKLRADLAEVDDIYAGDLIKRLKGSEGLIYAERFLDDRSEMVQGEIIRRAMEALGFDGIVDKTVKSKFPKMFEEVEGDVSHFIAFRPEQIKHETNAAPTGDPRFMYQTARAKRVFKAAEVREIADVLRAGIRAGGNEPLIEVLVTSLSRHSPGDVMALARELTENASIKRADKAVDAIREFASLDPITRNTPMPVRKKSKSKPYPHHDRTVEILLGFMEEPNNFYGALHRFDTEKGVTKAHVKAVAEEVLGYPIPARDTRAQIIKRMEDAPRIEALQRSRRNIIDKINVQVSREVGPNPFGLEGPDAQKYEMVEKFARGFEQYFREGEAPVSGLDWVFEMFSDFLRRVYQSADELDVELSDEVRLMMGRMISASEEHLPSASAAARRQLGYARIQNYDERIKNEIGPELSAMEAEDMAAVDADLARLDAEIDVESPDLDAELRENIALAGALVDKAKALGEVARAWAVCVRG